MTTRPPDHPLAIRAEAVRLSPAAIEAFATDLPEDKGSLNALLEACIDRYDARAFTVVALAALHRSLSVDARHLVRGARLLPHPGFIAKLAARMDGEVVAALLGAVADGRLSWQKEAVALYLAAYGARERELSGYTREIVRRTRMLARRALNPEVQVLAAATALILEDRELDHLIARLPAGRMLAVVDEWTDPLLDLARKPILWGVDEDVEVTAPTTRRRAVGRIGRNDPCRCGSGKKYKRCCWSKDQERLEDSSDVPGVTRAELRQNLEAYLTRERVLTLRAHELARLDPKRVDPAFHGIILNQLIRFEELDALYNFFEAIGIDGSEGHFVDAVDAAVHAGKMDKAQAFLRLAPLPDEPWLGFSLRLLKEEIEHCPALDILEAEVRKRVDDAAVDVACDLLRSQWPSLGILVARGVAPLAGPWDRETLLEDLGLARDRLDLPALDPTEGLQDIWGFGEESELYDEDTLGAEPAYAAEAPPPRDEDTRQRLEQKETELTELRNELSFLRRKLEAQTKPASPSSASGSREAETAAHDDPRVAELRERVRRLRSELTERHAERNSLRRQLERTLKRVDKLESERTTEADEERHAEADDEQDAEPLEAPVTLSFRFPAFSKRFRSSAAAVPDPVRRRAVVITSRIAAGDEAAFRGTKRLRAARELYRQRIGREYRLLFRMHAEEIEAVDIVPRKQLERSIRELTRG